MILNVTTYRYEPIVISMILHLQMLVSKLWTIRENTEKQIFRKLEMDRSIFRSRKPL